MKIGVLAIQGSVFEHQQILKNLGAEIFAIRNPNDFPKKLDGIIFPGGESTAIGKIFSENGLDKKLKKEILSGLPVFSTCAGTILLANCGSEFSLKVGDFEVKRNFFGSQLQSFQAELKINSVAEKFPAVFIRAPQICKIGKPVQVLAKFDNKPVLIRNKNILAATFHPELTSDQRLHQFFLEKICR